MRWKGIIIFLSAVMIAVFMVFLGRRGTTGTTDRVYVEVGGVECLAKNIYFEARNESLAGRIAVGQTTLNRVRSKKFPGSICDVVYQGSHFKNGTPKRDMCQFSWYCDGASDKIKNKRAWAESIRVASYLANGRNWILDITDGAEFYHADYVSPRWARSKKKTTQIDRHIFYR